MRNLIVFIFVLILISGYATDVSAKATPVDIDFVGYFDINDEQDDCQRNIACLERAIEEDPGNYIFYSLLAFFYDCVGDYENELDVLKRMLKYRPEDLEDKDAIYGNLARACLLTDRIDEAKPWIDKADKYNPNNISNRWQSFSYHVFKNKYKIAAKELKRISELETAKQDCYYEAYLFALEEIDNSKSIVSLFKEAVKTNPRSPLSHRVLGIAIRNSSIEEYEKNIPKAMKELEKALELDPKYIPTYTSIAVTHMTLAVLTENDTHYRDALDWLNKAYEIEPDNVRLFYAMGDLFYYMKDYEKAIEKFEIARSYGLEEEPLIRALALSYNNKAYAIYRSGENLKHGLELINKAIDLIPDNGIILGTKAEILYKLGKYQEARKYIKQALELEPDHEEMKQDLALIEEAMNGSPASNK